MKTLRLVLAFAVTLATAAYAEGQSVFYWVKPGSGSGNSCTSLGQPCSTLQQVADLAGLSSGAVNKDHVVIKLLPGTYNGDAGIVDLVYTNAVSRNGTPADVEVNCDLQTSTDLVSVDGGVGASSGTCTWAAGSAGSSFRAQCTGTSGLYATNTLQQHFVQLGTSNSVYPEGTCGTYPVESNDAGILTVEFVTASTKGFGSAPSACTGVLPYVIKDSAVTIAGYRTDSPKVTAWPPFTAGLPDGGFFTGSLDGNKTFELAYPTAQANTYQWSITNAGPAGALNFSSRGCRFKPGQGGIIKMSKNAGATFNTTHFLTNTGGFGGIYLAGGTRVTVARSMVARNTALPFAGTLFASRDHQAPEFIQLLYTTGSQNQWYIARSGVENLEAFSNFLSQPGSTPWVGERFPNFYIGYDKVETDVAGAGTIFGVNTSLTNNLDFHADCRGRFDAVDWQGNGTSAAGLPFPISWTPCDLDIDPGGTNKSVVNLPNMTNGFVQIARGSHISFDNSTGYTSFNVGDAGYVANFGTIGGAPRTFAQIDAGTPQNILCNQYSPGDGCVSINANQQ